MLFESPDFAVWEWKYAWKKFWVRIIVRYQSGGCTSFFFFPPPSGFFYLFFFLFRTSLFFPAVQGNHFFSHRDHALWRHVEFEMEKENGRISCSCNTWKKIKTCSVDLCYHQQLVTPGASTAFKHVCWSATNLLSLGQAPSSCPYWARGSTAFVWATWVQMFLPHRSCLTWCGYNSSGKTAGSP